MSEKRLITSCVTKGGTAFTVGEEVEFHGIHKKVGKVAYQGDRHKTVGSAYTPCYTIEFVNDTVRAVIPHHEMAIILTDSTEEAADENGVPIPELPED